MLNPVAVAIAAAPAKTPMIKGCWVAEISIFKIFFFVRLMFKLTNERPSNPSTMTKISATHSINVSLCRYIPISCLDSIWTQVRNGDIATKRRTAGHNCCANCTSDTKWIWCCCRRLFPLYFAVTLKQKKHTSTKKSLQKKKKREIFHTLI